MKYLYTLPVVATLLLGGFAMAETVAAPLDGPASRVAANDTPAAAPDAGQPGAPDQAHKWHWHHGPGMMRRHNPLADLPKPLSADAVKNALEAEFAKRPQVKSVTETAPNILTVEIIDREGKAHKFELNETTGEHRRSW